jgi:magnesium transporter
MDDRSGKNNRGNTMLISSALYESGKKIQDVPVELAASRVQTNEPGFHWLAFQEPNDDEVHQLEAQFQLPALATEDIRHSNKYPKLEEYDQTLFVVMGLLEVKSGQVKVGELAVFLRKNLLLSVRKDADQSFRGVRTRCEKEPENLCHGPGFVFYALMDSVVDRYFPVIEALELELETIELNLTDVASSIKNIKRLYALKRKVTVVRHAILPLMEVVGKLHGGRVPAHVQGLGDYFRDISDHLERLGQSLETLRETITLAVQVAMANNAVEQSITTRRLAAWAAIFAVQTLLTGIWGMNFEFMPELHWRWGYPASLLVMAVITVFLYTRLKKKGWL